MNQHLLRNCPTLLLLALFPLGCSPTPSVTVSGPITDLGNGEPLAGARVCLADSDLCTETNEAGTFSLNGVEASTDHAIHIDLEGYLPGMVAFEAREADMDLAVISLGGDILMDLQMAILEVDTQAGSGQVVFSISNGIFGDGINVPNISTELSPGGESGAYYLNSNSLPDVELQETSTNGGGLFVNVPSGNHTLTHMGLPAGCTTILGWEGPESLIIPVSSGRVSYARIECADENVE